MEPKFSELAEAYRRGLAEGEAAAPGACPEVEKIVACVRGKISKRERRQIVEHIAACGSCAKIAKAFLDITFQEERLFEALAKVRRSELEQERVRARPRILARKPLLAVLAGLAVVTGGVFVARRGQEPVALRGGLETEIVAVAPVKARVSRQELRFGWKPVRGATLYTVEVFDGTMGLIWKSPSTLATEAPPGASLLEGLKPGGSYFWRVTAERGDRKAIDSGLNEFTIRED